MAPKVKGRGSHAMHLRCDHEALHSPTTGGRGAAADDEDQRVQFGSLQQAIRGSGDTLRELLFRQSRRAHTNIIVAPDPNVAPVAAVLPYTGPKPATLLHRMSRVFALVAVNKVDAPTRATIGDTPAYGNVGVVRSYENAMRMIMEDFGALWQLEDVRRSYISISCTFGFFLMATRSDHGYAQQGVQDLSQVLDSERNDLYFISDTPRPLLRYIRDEIRAVEEPLPPKQLEITVAGVADRRLVVVTLHMNSDGSWSIAHARNFGLALTWSVFGLPSVAVTPGTVLHAVAMQTEFHLHSKVLLFDEPSVIYAARVAQALQSMVPSGEWSNARDFAGFADNTAVPSSDFAVIKMTLVEPQRRERFDGFFDGSAFASPDANGSTMLDLAFVSVFELTEKQGETRTSLQRRRQVKFTWDVRDFKTVSQNLMPLRTVFGVFSDLTDAVQSNTVAAAAQDDDDAAAASRIPEPMRTSK